MLKLHPNQYPIKKIGEKKKQCGVEEYQISSSIFQTEITSKHLDLKRYFPKRKSRLSLQWEL